jgi:hypothetical protein
MHALARLATFSQANRRALRAFPIGASAVADVLPQAAKNWPSASPFSPEDFARRDESRDSLFYETPRFCYHIDEAAVEALRTHYSTAFRAWARPSILDLCASHVSHFPSDVSSFAGRRVALGMNLMELQRNTQVDEFVAQDLNINTTLPFEDNSFDIVTNAVSIDYLTQPLAVCSEVRRVLKPGGAAIFSLSNRCFPSKAVDMWLRTNDLEHVYVVGAYFHYAGGFKPALAEEISPNKQLAHWQHGTSHNDKYLSVVTAFVNK